MDEKYCIKRTKMNKKGHFAYNLGIWLGLLRVSYGFDSRREYQNDWIIQSFFYTQRRIERLLTQPDSRTLGRLAAIREYQNNCEDSRFYMMKRKGWRFRTHKKDFDSRCFFFAFHNFAPECFLISQSKHARQEQYEPWSRRRIFDKYCVTLAA